MKTMNEWIDIRDSLPEEGQIVDIFTHSQGRWVEVEFYNDNFYAPEQDYVVDDDGFACSSMSSLIELDDITHWMPLPEPPK